MLKIILKYAKCLGAENDILFWLRKNEKKIINQDEIEHIIDYMIAKNPKLKNMTYVQAKNNCDKWLESQIKKGNHIKESKNDIKIILDFKDGFKFVQLIGKNAYEREGFLMSHCVASYYNKNDEIYSLRDKKNMPHCTISKSSQQIKGKGNGCIDPKYIKYVVEFLKYIGINIRKNEMKNLGYIDISDIKDDNVVFTSLFKEKYFYKNNKILDKNGNDYHNLTLWSKFKLFTLNCLEVGLKITWNFDIKKSVKTFISATSGNYAHSATSGNYAHSATSGNSAHSATSGNYAHSATSGNYAHSATSGDSAHSATSGNYAHSATSGNYAHSATSGYSAHSATSGDSAHSATSGNSAHSATSGYSAHSATSGNYAHSATSGYYAHSATSGNSAHSATSGNYAHSATSGYYAHSATSGNYAHSATSGYYAHSATSGYSAHSATSGNYAHSATSGNYAHSATSGDYAHSAVKGMNSIVAAIGRGSHAKGILGSWIVLSEIDGNCKVLCVKTAQIDGINLKSDQWYKLENGEFIEINNTRE
jgi:hypothetical protein